MTTRPSLPESYTVPAVWQVPTDPSGQPFGGMNRPTAGKRSERDLPVGKHPLQLYSLGTPNGQKVTILLEELGVDYDAWKINIMQLDQFTSGFVAINPNSKIPALVDNTGEKPIRVFETGSILLHLAEKYGKFIPTDPALRAECLNWLFWNVGTAPFLGGGFGHFYKYAPVSIEYGIDRFTMETKRILDVLDQQLSQNKYVSGQEYTIADMAIFPWIRCLDTGYNAKEFLQLDSYANVKRWSALLLERDAVKRGLRVNGFGPDAVENRHEKSDFEKAAL
ncbi:glutathione S-transferase [Globomyces pollinis-pini]|nr:glutathione S-transferase [Globomyces pollinis-pini]KAJ2994731.1 hypothetical protein HDV02_001343 [Globomyces sp. JEL0801]